MKEIIYTDELERLEASYLEKNRAWKLEKMILESFSKQELKEFIEQCEKDYMSDYMPYKFGLSRQKFRDGYEKYGELERYFLEQCSYYFSG